jgi:predicted LPLAT superfamily acyltransferase
MSQAWLAQRERGTLGAMRLIAWITQHFGYAAGRALLHPICLYFVVFSRPARRASRDYLRRVLGRPPRWRDVYRHYHTFASTILDRVLLLTGRSADFDLRVNGPDVVAEALACGRGLLLLGAHVGSFELCRIAGADRAGLVVNVVMHEANADKITTWMRETSPERAPNVIAPGRPETMLRIRDALARGEIVAMLGDRPIGRTATQSVRFLDADAVVPTGPLRLALALDVPVVLFFGLYRAPRCYDLFFERMDTGAGDPQARLAVLVEAFVARVETHTRSAPYNWFNFYDFWDTR